jgi:hypothetical protein
MKKIMERKTKEFVKNSGRKVCNFLTLVVS